MQRTLKANSQKAGFTLVELAIVLVIIGLIIGGVLVGQDMIKSAEVRSTISQWEKFNAASNTFRDKFGGIPGDLKNATNYGLNDRTSATVGATTGDGNGILEDCAATPGMLVGCETAAYFEDLSLQNMIPQGASAVGAFLTANHTAAATLDDTLPEAKIGGGVLWSVYGNSGRNYFYLSAADVAGAGPTVTDGVQTIDAFNIDRKVDDANPLTGVVLATSDRGTNDTGTGGATDCIDTGLTPDAYNTATDAESVAANCQLQMRMN